MFPPDFSNLASGSIRSAGFGLGRQAKGFPSIFENIPDSGIHPRLFPPPFEPLQKAGNGQRRDGCPALHLGNGDACQIENPGDFPGQRTFDAVQLSFGEILGQDQQPQRWPRTSEQAGEAFRPLRQFPVGRFRFRGRRLGARKLFCDIGNYRSYDNWVL